jgi:hypothetical protein
MPARSAGRPSHRLRIATTGAFLRATPFASTVNFSDGDDDFDEAIADEFEPQRWRDDYNSSSRATRPEEDFSHKLFVSPKCACEPAHSTRATRMLYHLSTR